MEENYSVNKNVSLLKKPSANAEIEIEIEGTIVVQEKESEIDQDIEIDIMMIDIDIKGVIRIREEDIEKQGRNQQTSVIIAARWDIGLINAIHLKKGK